MNIFFHHYQLSERRGALLKVEFENGLIGYADCHPWTELGDLPLHDQLHSIANQKTTPLTSRSLQFARIDAQGRSDGRNLFESLSVPKSHFLFMDLNEATRKEFDQALDEGFDHFKVKLGKQLEKELEILIPLLDVADTHWRLDFNNRLQASDTSLLKKLNENAIEFVEDPFPCDDRWTKFPFPIACDRQERATDDSYQFKIFKPAVEEFLVTQKPLVITSYLGHPLGQVADAFSAANLAKSHDVKVCGLLSHRVYPRNLFSEQLSWKGPEWKNPEGTGFGFDVLLNSIKWQRL